MLSLFIYFERERVQEGQRERERERERGRGRIPIGLCTVSMEPDAGLELAKARPGSTLMLGLRPDAVQKASLGFSDIILTTSPETGGSIR